MSALGANVEIGLEIGLEESLAAAGALAPQPFGAYAALLVITGVADRASGAAGWEIAVLALEPGHAGIDCKRSR